MCSSIYPCTPALPVSSTAACAPAWVKPVCVDLLRCLRHQAYKQSACGKGSRQICFHVRWKCRHVAERGGAQPTSKKITTKNLKNAAADGLSPACRSRQPQQSLALAASTSCMRGDAEASIFLLWGSTGACGFSADLTHQQYTSAPWFHVQISNNCNTASLEGPK